MKTYSFFAQKSVSYRLPNFDIELQKMDYLKTDKVSCDKNDPLELKLMCLSLRHKKISRFMQVLVVIVHILGCINCIAGKLMLYNQLDGFRNEVVVFINCLSDFLLAVVNIFAIMGFGASAFILKLINFINTKKFLVKKESVTFFRCIQILRIGPIVPICLSGYFIGFRLGWAFYRYFLPTDIWYFCLNSTICSLMCIVYKIKVQFTAVNDCLEELGNTYTVPNGDPKFSSGEIYTTDQIIKSLIDLSNHYNHLCNFLDRFNKFIKGFLVIVFMCITVNILYNCTVLIQYVAKPRVINGNQTKIFVLFIETMAALNTVVSTIYLDV